MESYTLSGGLAWAMNGSHPLFVAKAATVHGDTRFDVQLVKQ
jgi:hypothetical protein